MGLLSSIFEKLGLGSRHSAAPSAPATPAATAAPKAPAAAPAAATVVAPAPVAMVDVVADLERRARANPQKLNWKTSIVDLLKLLDIDSSLTARKALAAELGCPPELMGDSARMNMWLHKQVMVRIAENGGNVPKDLLD